MTKVCLRCHLSKALDDFHVCKAGKLGRQSYCKDCAKAREKEIRQIEKARQIADGTARKERPASDEVIEQTCVSCQMLKPAISFRTEQVGGRTVLMKRCRACLAAVVLKSWTKLRRDNPVAAWCRQALNQSKIRARKDNVPHELQASDVLAIAQRMHCEYCDIPVQFDGKVHAPQVASIDKIEPEKGYTVANTVLCCYKCNMRKSDSTAEDLLRLGERVRLLRSK